MTNFWEELDKVTLQLRNSYLMAYGSGNFELAAHRLYARNAAAPLEARVDDMPPFKAKARTNLEMTNKAKQQAFDYCNEYEPLVETAMSKWRTENMANMNMI